MREQDEQEQLAARLELAAKILALIYGLISVLSVVWILIPEHRRRLMMMRLAQAIQNSASRAACRSGQAAMGLELASGTEAYAVPYALSRLAGKARALYERARYTA